MEAGGIGPIEASSLKGTSFWIGLETILKSCRNNRKLGLS